jgi:hypothetical protein
MRAIPKSKIQRSVHDRSDNNKESSILKIPTVNLVSSQSKCNL